MKVIAQVIQFCGLVNRRRDEQTDEWTMPGDNTSAELKLKAGLKNQTMIRSGDGHIYDDDGKDFLHLWA